MINNYYNVPDLATSPFARQFNDTKRFLKQYDELIVANSNKGNNTVVMYRDDYEDKTTKILDDNYTYKKLEKDPTAKVQKQVITKSLINYNYEFGFIYDKSRKNLN